MSWDLWKKDIVQWRVGEALYLSVPFTWLIGKAQSIAESYNGKVYAGGPAVRLMGCDWADTVDETPYDVLSFHNPLATFTTRGCVRSCPFCAVPKIEGEFRELKDWKPNPIVCDNNLLASSPAHFNRVIQSLTQFPFVDFNQGLDVRLIRPLHLDQFGRLRGVKLRFSFDHLSLENYLFDVVRMCQRYGFKDIGVYVLLGFNDTPDEAIYRLEFVRSLGIRPNPMRYQPLDALKKNIYVAPGWTEKELLRVMRYYSRLRWLEHIPFNDFDYLSDSGKQQGSLF